MGTVQNFINKILIKIFDKENVFISRGFLSSKVKKSYNAKDKIHLFKNNKYK